MGILLLIKETKDLVDFFPICGCSIKVMRVVANDDKGERYPSPAPISVPWLESEDTAGLNSAARKGVKVQVLPGSPIFASIAQQ